MTRNMYILYVVDIDFIEILYSLVFANLHNFQFPGLGSIACEEFRRDVHFIHLFSNLSSMEEFERSECFEIIYKLYKDLCSPFFPLLPGGRL